MSTTNQSVNTITREHIRDAGEKNEQSILDVASQLNLSQSQIHSIERLAKNLVSHIKQDKRLKTGLDKLLNAFSLSSPEGLSLMNIAEAYLRIPDKQTTIDFIYDQLQQGQWQLRLSRLNDSMLVRLIAKSMHIATKILAVSQDDSRCGTLTKLLKQAGAAAVLLSTKAGIRAVGRMFIMAESIESAHSIARKHRPNLYSYDMLGEAALTDHDALRNFLRYRYAIEWIGRENSNTALNIYDNDSISVKLSALHPRYNELQASRLLDKLGSRVIDLAQLAAHYNVSMTIDAEESHHIELALDVIEMICKAAGLSHWMGLGIAVQAYNKNALALIDYIDSVGKKYNRRFMVRLVKGAYWDTEIIRAQTMGVDNFPTYTQKVHTDLNYIACAQKILNCPQTIYPQFATHNALTVSYLLELVKIARHPDPEFQSLYGMGKELYQAVRRLSPQYRMRVYAPVGTYPELLPYLVRRILENGANSSFVHQMFAVTPATETLHHPIEGAIKAGGHPHPMVTAPINIFRPQRLNSKGCDFTLRRVQSEYLPLMTKVPTYRKVIPSIIASNNNTSSSEKRLVYSPANNNQSIGEVTYSRPPDVDLMVETAKAAQQQWISMGFSNRAAIINHIADKLEESCCELVSLCIHEAGKTAPNAWNDLREAVDFCRYYASCIREDDDLLHQRIPYGVLAAIAPWNFPIAIFTGEVVACLAMGNAVVAKAAESTQLIGDAVIQCMYKAGVPREILHFASGCRTIGSYIVEHPGIDGVVFTGSNGAARNIYKSLLGKKTDALIIAETGGINAMIVDSTVLPERVVRYTIESAFDSAGQRCSALRILCLQNEIADVVLMMLFGAMRELHIGDPGHLVTDIGPLISKNSLNSALEYINKMRSQGHRVHQFGQIDKTHDGYFMVPTIIEVSHVCAVEKEVFAPVLHVVRYQKNELNKLIDDINKLGFALTFGIQSRNVSFAEKISAKIDAGNIYINRSITGAIVGTQPFGGHKLSGTGPKAGGPFYLHSMGKISLHNTKNTADAIDPHCTNQWWQWLHTVSPISEKSRNELMCFYQQFFKLKKEQVSTLPFGEKNIWQSLPQSKVMLIPKDQTDWITQLCACVIATCVPVADETCVPMDWIQDLPSCIKDIVTISAFSSDFRIFLIHQQHPDFSKRCSDVINMEGELRRLVIANDSLTYDPMRLMNEKTISINTADTGASTDLVMLDDSITFDKNNNEQ